MRRSRLGAILAIVVLGAVAVFASTASGSRQADVRIGVFLASAANTYWTQLQGARDVAKKYGNVKLTVYDAQFNTQKQVNQLRDALISNKFDAWFIGPNDGGPLSAADPARRSRRASRWAARSSPAGRTSATRVSRSPARSRSPSSASTRTASCSARASWRAARGRARARSLPAARSAPASLEKARFRAQLDHQEEQGDQGRLDPGRRLSRSAGAEGSAEHPQAHPGVDVIVSSGDQMIDGAYRAIRLAGIPDGQIKLYGNGCTFEAKRLILAGKQAGCSDLPAAHGGQGRGRPARAGGERRADQEPLDRPADAEPDRAVRYEGEHRQVQA